LLVSYHKINLALEKDELQKIINHLESNSSKEEAYFGIFQYGGGPDESFVKANKQGLELFAADMLKASRDANDILADKEKTIIPLDFEEDWIDGDTFVQYVEPSIEKKENVPYIRTWRDQAQEYFFVGILLLVVTSIIVGFITIISWFF
jgi:hypothetical protein